MKYEIVVRRRHRLTTAIAAVGEMLWADDVKKFSFVYKVPDNSEVNPVILIEVDVYEGEEHHGHGDYFHALYRGQGVRFVWDGPQRRDDDDEQAPDDPTPPGIALTFDPNELLRPLIAVGAP